MAHRRRIRGWLAVGATAGLLLVGCGGDDDTAESGSDAAETAEASDDGSDASGDADAGTADAGGDDAAGDDAAGDDAAGDDAAGDDAGAPSGGGAGTLVLGDETIALESARCYLQEQDAAAGGGKILFVAQGSGTNAAGEEVLVDVTRWDEDSDFTGDDVLVDIGDFTAEDSISVAARGEIGMIELDGRTVRGDDLTFEDLSAGISEPGSLEINC